MKKLFVIFQIAWLSPGLIAESASLFDGRSFEGWEGNTHTVWRIHEGAIVGGSMHGNPQNEFLSTIQTYRDFKLRLEYKLTGTEGFINGGVQFRSRRLEDPSHEMIGYQADIGAGFSGFLYDESRRRTMLAKADTDLVEQWEKPGEWNQYEILAQGPEVRIFLNDQLTCRYVEDQENIPLEGKIALQIHGDSKAEIAFRNINLEILPPPQTPTESEILKRFGDGQPIAPYPPFRNPRPVLMEDETIVFVGQENWVREQKSGALESRLAVSWVERKPRFRFMAWEADTVYEQWRDLNFGSWKDQLQTAEATTLVIQFGQMESLDGTRRIAEFESAYHRLLDEFSSHTRRFILVSPMPFERPMASHAPDLTQRNSDVLAYVGVIRHIAEQRSAVFIDLFSLLQKRPPSAQRLTIDGIHLTPEGLETVGQVLADALGAKGDYIRDPAELRQVIVQKNRLWFDAWRPANWSFAYGDRASQKFGGPWASSPSLKESFEQRKPLIEALDEKIQAMALGEEQTKSDEPPESVLTETPEANALTPAEQLSTFTVADGFQINLFASEAEGVIKPTQIAWDEFGRLYVACSPTYPQFLAGESYADFIQLLEDDDKDGRADRSWRFAEGLRMVQGVEPGPEGGVYVCDFDQLLLLKDLDKDGRADETTILYSGFGIGDTHQLVNSISHGPDGSLWFTQGLHAMSLVETPWGIARLDRAGVWRWRPRTLRLDGFFGGGMAGANCWGVAMDDFGQVFHKSGDRPHGYWTLPGMVRGASPSGSGSRVSANDSYNLSPEQYHSVGPLFETSPKTTSLDIIGTRAMPKDLQGCAVIGGYMGSLVELHRFSDADSGFKTTQLPRLVESSHHAFRPVDVSVGPDGAVYAADWYNPVIGHYQASYVDPNRDKSHGRIWRISSIELPAVKQPKISEMAVEGLMEQLKSSERWTRYQAKRLLYYKNSTEVLDVAREHLSRIQEMEDTPETFLVELTGIFEAHESPRPDLLNALLNSKDFRVRAYGAHLLGPWADGIGSRFIFLKRAVDDAHPRVRLAAVIAASYIREPEAAWIAVRVLTQPMDAFLEYALRQSLRSLQTVWEPALARTDLSGLSDAQREYLDALLEDSSHPKSPGEELYTMACMACHQADGKGLKDFYPSLADSDWASGDPDRLIKIVLHGLAGPITLNGETFHSQAPIQMPALGALEDEQIAKILTFIRGHFGNKAPAIEPGWVQSIRAKYPDRTDPWTETDLFQP